MYDEQSQMDSSSITMVRIAFAIIFIAIAIPLGVWVLSMVNDSIHGVNTPAIIEKIVPAAGASFDVNTPSLKFELPKPFFSGMSYFILYLFLLIPTTMAIALIKGSAALLRSDIRRPLQQLIDAIRKVNAPK